MRPIHAGRTPVKHPSLKIAAAAMAALGAVLAAGPAPADDGAAASGRDVSQAHGGANGGAAGDGAAAKGPPAPDGAALTSRDVELAPPPRHGPPGPWRRANMGAKIANTKAVGLPPPLHIAPRLQLGNAPPAQRNAINMTLPPGHDHPGPGGIRTTSTVGGSIRTTNSLSAPPTAGRPPFGAAINGTGMGRMVSGSIGGPANDHSGINGTSIRPKH